MNNPLSKMLLVVVFVLSAMAAIGMPQNLPPPPIPTMHVEHPLIQGRDPIPVPAVQAIYGAYKKYEVVAMDAGHGNQNLDQFILSLLSSSHFPGDIKDIVVECVNSAYQPILDRYVSSPNR